MKYLLAAVFITCSSSAEVLAKDLKFVGVWEGPYDTPIYTKLVFHEDQSLTYCEVSSCHNINCMKMDYDGALDATFTYIDWSGNWKFERISDDEIEGTFTNQQGDVSLSIYEPE
ncbi:MAG: hypothetical protein AB8B79_19815 [Granulosicoccus sp.]